uniref:Uncharacterized protein n=1 Tax=Rhizophora mucronata TaxID=61149 RepID=A0A2P2KL74_RHIMU
MNKRLDIHTFSLLLVLEEDEGGGEMGLSRGMQPSYFTSNITYQRIV